MQSLLPKSLQFRRDQAIRRVCRLRSGDVPIPRRIPPAATEGPTVASSLDVECPIPPRPATRSRSSPVIRRSETVPRSLRQFRGCSWIGMACRRGVGTRRHTYILEHAFPWSSNDTRASSRHTARRRRCPAEELSLSRRTTALMPIPVSTENALVVDELFPGDVGRVDSLKTHRPLVDGARMGFRLAVGW